MLEMLLQMFNSSLSAHSSHKIVISYNIYIVKILNCNIFTFP